MFDEFHFSFKNNAYSFVFDYFPSLDVVMFTKHYHYSDYERFLFTIVFLVFGISGINDCALIISIRRVVASRRNNKVKFGKILSVSKECASYRVHNSFSDMHMIYLTFLIRKMYKICRIKNLREMNLIYDYLDNFGN